MTKPTTQAKGKGKATLPSMTTVEPAPKPELAPTAKRKAKLRTTIQPLATAVVKQEVKTVTAL